MEAFLSLLISLPLALLYAIVAWGTRQVKTWQIAIVFVISLVLWVLGAAFSLGWYPWTSILDFLVAVGAGILIARAIPPRFRPFLIFLVVVSALDVTQILLSAHTSSPPTPQSTSISGGQLYSNFTLFTPWITYHIGVFDPLILTTMAVYWCRRGGEFLIAYIGMAIGEIVGFAVLIVFPDITIPLVPFLLLGWLCSVGIDRYSKQAIAKDAKVPVQEEAASQD